VPTSRGAAANIAQKSSWARRERFETRGRTLGMASVLGGRALGLSFYSVETSSVHSKSNPMVSTAGLTPPFLA
jgi:hypothetical protein